MSNLAPQGLINFRISSNCSLLSSPLAKRSLSASSAAVLPDAACGAGEIVRAMRADLFDVECDFYLAGPRPFVQVLHQELRAAGVPAAQLFSEVIESEPAENLA